MPLSASRASTSSASCGVIVHTHRRSTTGLAAAAAVEVCGHARTLSRLALVAFASSVSLASVVRSARSDARTSPVVASLPAVPAATQSATPSQPYTCGKRRTDRYHNRRGAGCHAGGQRTAFEGNDLLIQRGELGLCSRKLRIHQLRHGTQLDGGSAGGVPGTSVGRLLGWQISNNCPAADCQRGTARGTSR